MVGGYAVLKDVYKTIVFELAKYRNSISETPVIPERVITRPPSAELRPDQKDQDSLPAYEVLDAILYSYIEEDMSQDDIIAKGFDKAVVEKVIRLVDRNEYKRRQGAIGPRISSRAFTRERRYPIMNGWTPRCCRAGPAQQFAEALMLEQTRFIKKQLLAEQHNPYIEKFVHHLYISSDQIALKQIIQLESLQEVVQKYAFEFESRC